MKYLCDSDSVENLYPSAFSRFLWLIGGTQESSKIACAFAHTNLPCTISVTTESARSLYPYTPNLNVCVGRFNLNQIEEFLLCEQIVAILDASHPFAVEISQNAIAASQKLNIPYLRYERPVLEQGSQKLRRVSRLEQTGVDVGKRLDFETLLSGNYLQQERVLLTLGYRPLHLFQPWQGRATLFARILPSAIALEAAYASGFTPDRLICLRPPVSADLEAALIKQWDISLLVTKASGTPGGEDIKRSVASVLGIPLIVIDRPTVGYPQQTSDLSVALEFCRSAISPN